VVDRVEDDPDPSDRGTSSVAARPSEQTGGDGTPAEEGPATTSDDTDLEGTSGETEGFFLLKTSVRALSEVMNEEDPRA